MKRLTLVCAVNSFSGFGLHGIQIARDLAKIGGLEISIRAIELQEAYGSKIPKDISDRIVSTPQPEPWELLLWAPGFGPTPGKKVAFFSMFEATRLPAAGVKFLNSAQVVIVPSAWNASTFSASGVDRPIRVVPLGVDPMVFHYHPPPRQGGLCVFGCGGRLFAQGKRKSIQEVIWAFLQAFPNADDARLKIKVMPDCEIDAVEDKRIEIKREMLSVHELADWYASLTCFVSASRGEGWGLMQHQAMAVGRPLMSANFGGLTEFFNPEFGYSLPFDFESAGGPYQGCGVWAKPDIHAMVEQMRRVYENRPQAFKLGKMAAQSVAHLTWENSSRKLLAVLEEHGALNGEATKRNGKHRVYYHSGNLGDIIYALSAIKATGGGDLLIGPEQNGTSPCAVPTSRGQFDSFYPLLKAQPYLHRIEYAPRYPAGSIDVDLNTFRDIWHNWPIRQREKINTLCRAHYFTLGILRRFREDDPWLAFGHAIPIGKIIIHRSARYHGQGFPWKELLKLHAGAMLFVGLEEEHAAFEREFGATVRFHKVRDLLEMARIIAGAKCCVMNQSFPLSVALGIGQRVFCEEWPQSPDCRFERVTYLNQTHGLKGFEKWQMHQ